ncbi:ferredoxin [2Fe-2S] [Halostagnicola kamekurae]|uniref:Ferredoxin [2Fe-2S] n=2 Tax=Halostagnicola kamekurae TaxID=619731 RepID=A0A1I6P973_9EURY|nr:ferredoxin [2Fe-2S] [Halostagnicola kamekurae]
MPFENETPDELFLDIFSILRERQFRTEQQAIPMRDSNLRLMPTVEYLNYEVLDDQGWEMDDDDLFENAADAGLDEEDYGTLDVAEGEYILEAAEAQGYDWPFSCRAGACANCAAIITEGEIDMDMQQILSDEEVEEKNVRLTCIGSAETDEVKIVYNAKHLDYLQNRVI